MTDDQQVSNPEKLRNAILGWLKRRLNKASRQKLESTFSSLSKDAEDWEVFSSFSGVPRYTGKESLSLTEEEKKEAKNIRPGWEPDHWTTDQLGRTFLVLGMAERSKNEFLDKLEKLFISSDMGEGIALYQSIPVLPYPDDLRERAAEGIRSNITSIFNAVALRNPYPADYLDEDAWNQVVLKALFVGSPLYLIRGINRRSNQTLATMLVEYAHERWSAGRSVSPELWRPVGPFINADNTNEIQKVIGHSDDIQKQAAVLALSAAETPEAKKLLEENSDLLESVKNKNITWDDIGKRAVS